MATQRFYPFRLGTSLRDFHRFLRTPLFFYPLSASFLESEMSSPRSRAQSSSASIPPDYITGSGIDAHAIEVRSKLHPFAQKNLDENILHLFENTLVLGPHWFGPVLPGMAELLKKDAEALCVLKALLPWLLILGEVRNSPVKWADWIDRLLPRYGGHWRRAGIYDAILLSKQSINRDENLLAAALCFWNSASNTFDFRVGPMAPTLLDMAQIFGFRPHGRPVDAVGDYHRRKNQEKVVTPFIISPATINQNCSFSNYLKRFSAEKDKDQQHMLFLLYWLNRFVFPNRSSAVLLEYRHLAEALHNHTDVGLGPTVLAHLFKNLHIAALENPLNLSAPGAFWMIQIWLQKCLSALLRVPDALQALYKKVGCSVASGDQKDLSLVPDRISICPMVGQTSKLSSGAEVYHPNFYARQLGCPQLIPLKSYRSCNRASSWRDADDLEVHKDARCAVNKINNSTDALYPSWEPNSCSSADFDAWWQTRFQNPSLTTNVGGQSVHAGKVIVSSVIEAGDLELRSADEEDEVQPEQTPAEVVLSGRRKRKGPAPSLDNTTRPGIPAGSPSPPPTKLKKLKKRSEVEYVAVEETAARKRTARAGGSAQEKMATAEEEDEIPAEVIVESIALAQKQQKGPSAELTSSELALFEDAEAEHSTATPEAEDQVERSVSDPVDQAELIVVVPGLRWEQL
ncbi:hypothetical protein Prudu_320S000300 [Prunus dulcis]|uniref:Aminotransferase-like plant mobile domain-containing protein n=1 Tax=Prunus dulcis TaxID=3755 RepID=A0A5H2XPA7_PRUDU|nr:hypothetical protein Prudu_320S000300 [Prunus dulcis]